MAEPQALKTSIPTSNNDFTASLRADRGERDHECQRHVRTAERLYRSPNDSAWRSDRNFFAYTSMRLAILCVVVIGKGVSAEAGWLPLDRLADVIRLA